MDCVFVKARKISRSLKGNRGSVVNYSKYLDRTLSKIDFTEKGKLLASGIEGTDEKPLAFWKKAEERELQTKRKDTARFAKEYIVSFPFNLPIEEMQKLSETIAKELSKINSSSAEKDKKSRVVNWYLHEPDKDGDERNFHSHFLLSEREYFFEKKEFAETKNRDWNSKATLREHKKNIGERINERLRALKLPEIKIELAEDEIIGINKTENQIKAQKTNRKMLKTCDRKIKLAEVKLNGLRGNERGIANSADGNSKSDSGLEKQFKEYQQLADNFSDFQRTADATERAEQERTRELEQQRRVAEEKRREHLQRLEEQRKLEAERAERERQDNARRNPKTNSYGSGRSR